MSLSPDGQAARNFHDARASEIEGLADEFLGFIETFEDALREGLVPPLVEKRLAQLIERAERLI